MRRLGCVIVDHDVGILGVDIDFGISGIGSGAGRFGGCVAEFCNCFGMKQRICSDVAVFKQMISMVYF